jgi:hypothetical protein
METFCGWIDCYASYAGNYMPPGWANLLAVGIDQPLPSSVTLCPEHARALRAQLKNPAQKIDQMSNGCRRKRGLWRQPAARELMGVIQPPASSAPASSA